MDFNEGKRMQDQLQSQVSAGNYREADRVLQDYLDQGGEYNDVVAIYDGVIGENLGDRERTWAAIRQGIFCNPENYELYVMLGNYYLDENREQSWLCYEHALACCHDPEDQTQIREMLRQLTQDWGIAAGRVAVVIGCQGYSDRIRPCIERVRRALGGCNGQIIVVTDRSGKLPGRDGEADQEWLGQQEDLVLVETEAQEDKSRTGGSGSGAGQTHPENSRAWEDPIHSGGTLVWERGIAAAWPDADCLLMDSSTLLPDHTLFWLRMALYGSDAAGTVGGMSGRILNSRLSGMVKNVAGREPWEHLARRLNVPMRYPCEVMPWMKGAAVLIRRQVLAQAGIPQTDFRNGGFLDREYGRKVETAGYRNLLCENSFLLEQEERAAGLDGAAGTPGASGEDPRDLAGICQAREKAAGGRTERTASGSQETACLGSGGKSGDGRQRFLLFYAGNEKGYYQDTRYFTSEITRELGRRGHETFICDLARGSHAASALEAYLAKGVDAVLTFNGEAIQKEELWQLWNRLGALVVNILMDPPFHMDLCPYLENPGIERYLLLCPDENHVEYVKQYYPQVKHVEFMPHGGTAVEGKPVPWREKSLDLLFSGTYTRPEGFLDVMRKTMKPEEFRLYASMGERLLQEPHWSVDQIVAETLFPDSYPLTPGRIQGAVTGMSLLDGWVRMVMRERVVTALVEGGVDLYVLGDGWQNCPCAKSPRLHSLSKERIPLSDTLAWMEKARINLNVMPWFKAGSHDRVFNAMLRGSVALTDPSSFFRKYFQDRKSIVYYSLEELEQLPEIVRSLLAHPDQAEAIARAGYDKAAAFTWEPYVEELLAKVGNCMG